MFFLSLSLLAPPSVGLNKPCRAFRIPTNDGDVVGVVVVALSSQCGRCFPLVFVRVVCKKPQEDTPASCLLANASLAPEHQLVSITNLRSRICEVSSASHSSCLQLGRWVLNTQPAVCFVPPPGTPDAAAGREVRCSRHGAGPHQPRAVPGGLQGKENESFVGDSPVLLTVPRGSLIFTVRIRSDLDTQHLHRSVLIQPLEAVGSCGHTGSPPTAQ